MTKKRKLADVGSTSHFFIHVNELSANNCTERVTETHSSALRFNLRYKVVGIIFTEMKVVDEQWVLQIYFHQVLS